MCVRDLQQPVASSVECRHNGGMDVAAIQALKAETSSLIKNQNERHCVNVRSGVRYSSGLYVTWVLFF